MAKSSKNPAPKKDDAERSAKFVELATARVNRVLKGMSQIGNLSSKNYIHTEAQVKAILDALEAALGEVEARFTRGVSKPQGFSL